jgi:spore coat polysaccharide biosynthesis protein SpsF
MTKVGCIIQARMGSTRLPGKVMKELQGKSVLYHVIQRVKQSKLIDEIIIATTNHKRDEVIVDEAKANDVNFFRGSEEDVLSRYYYSAVEFGLDAIVRITSDCPLVDPFVIDEVVNFYLNNNYVLVTNGGVGENDRTYPRGLDTAIFSFDVLKDAHENATQKYQREHVTPYIYENFPDEIYRYKNERDLSEYRLTLDTPEDYELIKKIYEKLYEGKHDFYLDDIIDFLEKNPGLKTINENIKQKKVKE